ncbi:MAG: alpha-L-glutamate ligase-like protein [Desulfomonilaceae bacterium]|jgi:alpha-L-glutamate ligase-like protein
MLNIFRGLKDKGVLGINGRNANFTLKYNPRRFYPLVDDKLRTKRLAQANAIPVPELYALVEAAGQVRDLPDALKECSDFVIKPAHGSGGEGILIVSREDNGAFRRQNGDPLSLEELKHHVLNSLSGLYSLGGQPDEVLAEYRVEFDPVFEKISYEGVPDIRIVVMFGIPVMAMIRLPTKESDGKANLHQGAIGVGICMKTGTTLRGVWKNNIVTEHPDTGNPVTGLIIPWWDDLLELSAKWYELTELGYLGVDIVLDKSRGPLILELNARPGLNIQVANDSGLLPRLELAERYHKDLKNISERVAFAKDNFAVNAPH